MTSGDTLDRLGYWRWPAVVVAGAVAAGLVLLLDPLVGLVVAGILAVGTVLLTWRDAALAVLVFVTWTRLSDGLASTVGGPSLLEALIAGAAGVVAFRMLRGRHSRGLLRVAPIFLVVFSVYLMSLFFATDTARTTEVLLEVSKGMVVAILVIALLDRPSSLNAVIWSLIGAGALLSTLTLYQTFTGDYATTFFGLAVPERKQIVEGVEGIRAGGPVASTNYFAMILVALVPLAIDRTWRAPTLWTRLLAGGAAGMIVASVLLTVSRGGLLALACVLVLLAVWHLRSASFIVAVVIAVVAASAFLSTEQLARLGSVKLLIPGMSEVPRDVAIEDEFGGRASEMLAALMMFRDHPFLGVGLGNYNTHYLDYSSELGLDSRREARSAHSLYLEVAAETGGVGIFVFLFLLGGCGLAMDVTRRRLAHRGDSNTADLIAGLEIAVVGYLVASVLLHDAFPRYLWLLLGIGYALPNLLHNRAAPVPAKSRP